MKRFAFAALALIACGGPTKANAPPPEPPPPIPADASAPQPPSARAAAPVRFGAVVVTGKIKRDDVVNALKKSADAFHKCQTDPKMDGKVTLHFQIEKDGRSSNATADRASDIEDPTVQACTLQVLQITMFPAPEDTLPAQVIAPIIFEPRPTE